MIKKTILVVEDDVIAQMTISQMLHDMGFEQVALAADSNEVLDLIARFEVHLILMDVFINGVHSGIDLVKMINEDYQIPIIYLTASSDPKTFELIAQTKHVGLLEKPYNYDEIYRQVMGVFNEEEILLSKPIVSTEDSIPNTTVDSFSSGLLASVLETADVGICVTNRARKFVKVNNAYCQLYGYTEEELIGNDFTLVLPLEQHEVANKVHDDFLDELNEEVAGEWQVMLRDGRLRDVWVTAGRFVSEDGQPYKVTTVTDISERKQYINKLEEQIATNESLLQQVHHRVKNNLNTISGLLYLKEGAYTDQSMKLAIRGIRDRIATLALVHQNFYKTDSQIYISTCSFFPDLIKNLGKSYANDAVKVISDIEDFSLGNNMAVRLGLILNELMTNAWIHAFVGKTQGEIRVVIKKEDQIISLIVHDNGIGFKEIEETNSALGFKLIQSLLKGGRIIHETDNGTKLKLLIPFSE